MSSLLLLGLTSCKPSNAGPTILNVSYDPTREFYNACNKSFATDWENQHQQSVQFQQSHGGSGKQARAVMDGLNADIVSLALALDIDAIAAKTGLIPKDWATKFPHQSSPYTSTIVFLVRKGNPKGIRDWGDLVKEKVEIVTPNPKTSGGARWNYLAAWAWADSAFGGDQTKVHDYMKTFLQRVVVWDNGAGGATSTFVLREIGDVLLTWENEAFLAIRELGADRFEMVVPSMSILAEPPVAVVEKNAEKKGNLALAQAYVGWLFSPEAQKIAVANGFRPRLPQHVKAEDLTKFAPVRLVTVDEGFGGWGKAQATHFADGGTFDKLKGF